MLTIPVSDPTEEAALVAAELREAWPLLLEYERVEGFKQLSPGEAESFFLSLESRDQAHLLLGLPVQERRLWIRLLAPDDATDLIQQAPREEAGGLLDLLDEPTRHEVQALLAYAEDEAGGLMNPRYIRLRPDMSIDEAISYVRRQARARTETVPYAYVLDGEMKLLGIAAFREILVAPPDKRVSDVMRTNVITVREEMDQEELGRLFAIHNRIAIPVLDAEGRMKGLVTADDIVDVLQEEATEDIQKIGGTESLGAPYLQVSLGQMIRKRAGWLTALFLGEMLTASAMAHYEQEIAAAVVLALFIPLIISSGGNSGSQASTLVIRAIALGEARLRDWWHVFTREIGTGLGLGLVLGAIGMARILIWQAFTPIYGEHCLLVALTVGVALVGVVLWGTIAGSMLPFVLQRIGFDPASACAPFVATLVDVTGLVIYFRVARVILSGTLL
jgi:magnesium transporter